MSLFPEQEYILNLRKYLLYCKDIIIHLSLRWTGMDKVTEYLWWSAEPPGFLRLAARTAVTMNLTMSTRTEELHCFIGHSTWHLNFPYNHQTVCCLVLQFDLKCCMNRYTQSQWDMANWFMLYMLNMYNEWDHVSLFISTQILIHHVGLSYISVSYFNHYSLKYNPTNVARHNDIRSHKYTITVHYMASLHTKVICETLSNNNWFLLKIARKTSKEMN